jgi:hypothetical protein
LIRHLKGVEKFKGFVMGWFIWSIFCLFMM